MAAFAAPFILSAISLTVMLPQLTTIYLHPYYSNHLLYNLCYTMISCNIAFTLGYEAGRRRRLPNKIYDLQISKCRSVILAFALIGVTTSFTDGDGVIRALLRSFSQISFILSMIYLIKVPRLSSVVITSLIISMANILYFIFFIYGSRGSSLFLFVSILLSLSIRYPAWRSKINITVIAFFLLGSVVSASIAAFRDNLIKGEDHKISYIENFIGSFRDSHSEMGMDLGNGALLIDYSAQNNSYNYGTIFWNSFVYNYIPERIFGDGVKESLYFKTTYMDRIPTITNGITTTTGYFEAFATWWYFGFLIFAMIAYVMGIIWSRAQHSNIYLLLLLYSLGNVPMMATHSIQYVVGRWEYIIIFILPFTLFSIYRRRLNLDKR